MNKLLAFLGQPLAGLLLVLLLAPDLARPARGQDAPLFQLGRVRQRRVRVPLRVERNLPVVQVWLNEAGPYNFLLDTGVATSLLTEAAIADSLHLRHGQDFRVVGAGGQATGLLAYRAPGVRVRLGRPGQEAVARDMALLVLNADSLDLSGYVGLPIHGILGSELFRSFAVAFDANGSEALTLTRPEHQRPPRGRRWARVPLAIEGQKPYFMAEVCQAGDAAPRPLKLLLDTGASHALSIETTSDPALRVPATRLPAELGRGLNGPVRGVLGRVATVQLGRYRLPTVLTSFPDAADVHARADVFRNGSLGYDVLRRFRVVIDYPHQCLWLHPGPTFREPFEHDMAGLDLFAMGPALRRYRVLRVMPGTPAAAAGLEAGDELLTIGLAPVGVFTLTQLSRLLRSADGTVVHLVLRRPSGELRAARLRLQRRI